MATTSQQTGCIICGDKTATLKRGLCPMHHARYVKAASKMTCEEREAFESRLIEKKLLLPSRRGQKLSPHEDEFATAAAEFLAEYDCAHPAVDLSDPPQKNRKTSGG